MKLAKTGFHFATATNAGKIIVGVLMILHWILGWFVMSVVVFLRRDFGERYLSWLNILFGMTAIGFFTGIGNLFLSQGTSHLSWAIELAYYGVIGLGIYHRVVIWRKNRRGHLWHSYNPGASFIRLPKVPEEVVARWVEPLVLFAGAYIADGFHDAPLRLWLLIGGFALLVHEHVSYHMQRQQFLDMRDAMIESKNWGAVMSGKAAEQTQGYVVARSNLDIINRSPEMRDAYASLPEDVQRIMDREVV